MSIDLHSTHDVRFHRRVRFRGGGDRQLARGRDPPELDDLRDDAQGDLLRGLCREVESCRADDARPRRLVES